MCYAYLPAMIKNLVIDPYQLLIRAVTTVFLASETDKRSPHIRAYDSQSNYFFRIGSKGNTFLIFCGLLSLP